MTVFVLLLTSVFVLLEFYNVCAIHRTFSSFVHVGVFVVALVNKFFSFSKFLICISHDFSPILVIPPTCNASIDAFEVNK